MMSEKIELHPRMDGLDEAIICSQLLDLRSKPPPKFPWMTPERSYVNNTYGPRVTDTHAVHEPSLVAEAASNEAKIGQRFPDDTVRGEQSANRSEDRKLIMHKERDDAKFRASGKNMSPDIPPNGPFQSRYAGYSMPNGPFQSRYAGYSMPIAQRPLQQHVSGQAVYNRPPVDVSATYHDTTGLQNKVSPMMDLNNTRPPIPRTTAPTTKHSDTHHTFTTAQARISRPISRQPVTRLMPGLRHSPHMSRQGAPRGTGKVGLTLSQGSLAVIQSDVKNPLSAEMGVEISLELSNCMETKTAEPSKVSSKKVDNDSPYDKRYGHQKSGKITIVDEPTEARRKKIKTKESTAVKVLVSSNDNDLVLLDVSSEEELTVLGDVGDSRRGRTRTKQKHTDKTSTSRSANKQTRRFELDSDHTKRGNIPKQESRYKRSPGNREPDVEFHSIDEEQKNMANIRRWITQDKSKANVHVICDKDQIGKHNDIVQSTGQTPKSTPKGQSICDMKDRHDRRSVDSESVLEKEINTKKEKNKLIKKKKKSKKSKYSKIYPIDDGSENTVMDQVQLNKIAAMFCVESAEEAAIRRADAIMQNDCGKIRKVEICKEQATERKAQKKFEDIQNQHMTIVDDDDNFRPGVWSCNFELKTPTRSVNDATVIANAEHINRADDTNTIAENEKDRIDDDTEETDGKVNCVSGIRNFFRRIFKRK